MWGFHRLSLFSEVLRRRYHNITIPRYPLDRSFYLQCNRTQSVVDDREITTDTCPCSCSIPERLLPVRRRRAPRRSAGQLKTVIFLLDRLLFSSWPIFIASLPFPREYKTLFSFFFQVRFIDLRWESLRRVRCMQKVTSSVPLPLQLKFPLDSVSISPNLTDKY